MVSPVQFDSLQLEKDELTKYGRVSLLEIRLTHHITELKQEMEKNKLASLQVRQSTTVWCEQKSTFSQNLIKFCIRCLIAQ